MSEENEQKIKKLYSDLDFYNQESNLYRARSFTIGTAFGGCVEFTMRRSDNQFVYAIIQPVEVVEFIHQLASAVGCKVTVQPKNDFASWRSWKEIDNRETDVSDAVLANTNNKDPSEQPGLQKRKKTK